MIKAFLIISVVSFMFVFTGCQTNIAWYGQISTNEMTASTEGKNEYTPKSGDITTLVNRDYDTSSAVNTSQGSAKAENAGTQEEDKTISE